MRRQDSGTTTTTSHVPLTSRHVACILTAPGWGHVPPRGFDPPVRRKEASVGPHLSAKVRRREPWGFGRGAPHRETAQAPLCRFGRGR
uniref:Uncharacterized protein n=1 Tax=Oryza nivara TaxID=4536 RepID=A0A0E0I7I7_ORYNI